MERFLVAQSFLTFHDLNKWFEYNTVRGKGTSQERKTFILSSFCHDLLWCISAIKSPTKSSIWTCSALVHRFEIPTWMNKWV